MQVEAPQEGHARDDGGPLTYWSEKIQKSTKIGVLGAKKLPSYKAASLARKMAKKRPTASVTNEELHEDGRKIFGKISGPQAKLNFILAVVIDLLSTVFQNRLNPKTGQYTRDPGKASKGSSSEPSGE